MASAIQKAGGIAEAWEVNVSSAAAVESLVQATVSKHGRLDYMFNNAAIAVVGEIRDSVIDDWRKVLDVNLMGVIHGSLSAYEVMLRQGSGHIVNIASLTGLLPGPGLAPYSTSKWGAIGFTLALREEAAALGVRVTVACPSLVNTNIPDRTSYLKINKEAYLKRLPWRWMMDPVTAARTILRGVTRNKAMIVCPWHGWLVWWCYRLCPAVAIPLSRWTVRELRKLREASRSQEPSARSSSDLSSGS